MNIFCLLRIHKWKYSIEMEGYGKFVPVNTPQNPKIRLCYRCCRKEYYQEEEPFIVIDESHKLVCRRNIQFGIGWVKRDPSDSDIREFKINKILNS